MDLEITPAELKQRLDQGDKLLIVDVRESWEHQICALPGARLIPMNTIPANLAELQGVGEVILYCHHGMRSMNVAGWLREQGIESARSLAGGIDRWSTDIDPATPRY
jgi:rhodanese-related sulfurtransferase